MTNFVFCFSFPTFVIPTETKCLQTNSNQRPRRRWRSWSGVWSAWKIYRHTDQSVTWPRVKWVQTIIHNWLSQLDFVLHKLPSHCLGWVRDWKPAIFGELVYFVVGLTAFWYNWLHQNWSIYSKNQANYFHLLDVFELSSLAESIWRLMENNYINSVSVDNKSFLNSCMKF